MHNITLIDNAQRNANELSAMLINVVNAAHEVASMHSEVKFRILMLGPPAVC